MSCFSVGWLSFTEKRQRPLGYDAAAHLPPGEPGVSRHPSVWQVQSVGSLQFIPLVSHCLLTRHDARPMGARHPIPYFASIIE